MFGGFADILPTGCTLLAESAVAVSDIDRADLARRIQDAREDVADAKDDQTRTKAEQFLSQLTTLEGAHLAGLQAHRQLSIKSEAHASLFCWAQRKQLVCRGQYLPAQLAMRKC